MIRFGWNFQGLLGMLRISSGRNLEVLALLVLPQSGNWEKIRCLTLRSIQDPNIDGSAWYFAPRARNAIWRAWSSQNCDFLSLSMSFGLFFRSDKFSGFAVWRISWNNGLRVRKSKFWELHALQHGVLPYMHQFQPNLTIFSRVIIYCSSKKHCENDSEIMGFKVLLLFNFWTQANFYIILYIQVVIFGSYG